MMCSVPSSTSAPSARSVLLVLWGLCAANAVHFEACNFTVEDSDRRCNWSWGDEGRGFASKLIQPRSVSDGHGGKMTGIVAATDISRGAQILNVPISCVISQGVGTQCLVVSVLSESKNAQVKLMGYHVSRFIWS